MQDNHRKKLRITTIVFWILLLYIIAALVWWTISLLQQNQLIYELRLQTLDAASAGYEVQAQEAEEGYTTGIYKYVGEGAAFLLLIMVGAGYIYRSVRRQFAMQQQQQNFTMAVTHELKTPIAVSRLNLETLQKHQLDEEKRKKLLQVTLQETLRLDTLINNILFSSQMEGNMYRLSKDKLDLSLLVKEVIREFSDRYPERKIEIKTGDQLFINGDRVLIKLLASNLIENAHKYSSREKSIEIETARVQSKIQLVVADEGAGIADEEKKAVFQKFYRIGNEQTRKSKGTGLGLYIAQKIATEHGGIIIIKDNQPSGSKFIVQLPALA